MSAVSEIHAHNGVAGVEEGKKNCEVCRCAAVRLDVCVLCTKELFGSLACDILYDIHILAPAIVALAGKALCIFVGEYRSCRQKDSLGNDVFGCDQLDILTLTVQFQLTRIKDLFVIIDELIKKIHSCSPPQK